MRRRRRWFENQGALRGSQVQKRPKFDDKENTVIVDATQGRTDIEKRYF